MDTINPDYLAATDTKLLYWSHQIMQKDGPITLTVLPTNRCNLKCSFCSNDSRKIEDQLTLEDIKQVIESLPSIKAVEISGGGDPLMFDQIKELLDYLYRKNLKIGLITNGLALEKISSRLCLLDWIRISINSYIDYKHVIRFDLIPEQVSLGVAYILHPLSPSGYMNKLLELHKQYPKIQYCKICNDSFNKNHKDEKIMLSETCPDSWMYYYDREWKKPILQCFMGSIKPVLAPDKKIYPCSSMVLHEKKYNPERAISLEDCKNYIPYYCSCETCPFTDRNELVHKLLYWKDKHFEFV